MVLYERDVILILEMDVLSSISRPELYDSNKNPECPVPDSEDAFFAPMAGKMEGAKNLKFFEVPPRFSTNIFYNLGGQHTLTFYAKYLVFHEQIVRVGRAELDFG